MKLAHSLFEEPVKFKENSIAVLVIEDKSMFASLVLELIAQAEGAGGGFVLSDDDGELSFGTVDIISDTFRLDVNNRRNIGKLIAAMEQTAVGEGCYEDSCRITGEILSYAFRVAGEMDHNVDISEVKLSDIFKMCNARFAFDNETVCDSIMDYLKITHSIAKMELFVFVNLKGVLGREELEQLYKYVCYNKYNVLLIESSFDGVRLQHEKYKIIDADLCEIA